MARGCAACCSAQVQPLSAVQCLQVVEREQNGSQKTLRHFNPANASLSNLAEILPARISLMSLFHKSCSVLPSDA